MTPTVSPLLLLAAALTVNVASAAIGKESRVYFSRCASTSSSGPDYDCRYAMDKATDKCRTTKEVFVSKKGTKPGEAWKGYFKKPVKVSEVVVYNRKSSVELNRLNDFVIKLDSGKECAKYMSEKETSFRSKAFMCHGVTQMIAIETRMMDYLELCEVEVYGKELDDTQHEQTKATEDDEIDIKHDSSSGKDEGEEDTEVKMDTSTSTGGSSGSTKAATGRTEGDSTSEKGSTSTSVSSSTTETEPIASKTYKCQDVHSGKSYEEGQTWISYIDGFCYEFECAKTGSEYLLPISVKCHSKAGRCVSPEQGKGAEFSCEGDGRCFCFLNDKNEVAIRSINSQTTFVCSDSASGKIYQIGETWASKADDFCYHYKCERTETGAIHPYKTDCRDTSGNCVAPVTEGEGQAFACAGTGKCYCTVQDERTSIRRVHYDTNIECQDTDTGRVYSESDVWVAKDDNFCYHFKCEKTLSNHLHPYQVDCLNFSNVCVPPTEAGRHFTCTDETACACKTVDGEIHIYAEVEEK